MQAAGDKGALPNSSSRDITSGQPLQAAWQALLLLLLWKSNTLLDLLCRVCKASWVKGLGGYAGAETKRALLDGTAGPAPLATHSKESGGLHCCSQCCWSCRRQKQKEPCRIAAAGPTPLAIQSQGAWQTAGLLHTWLYEGCFAESADCGDLNSRFRWSCRRQKPTEPYRIAAAGPAPLAIHSKEHGKQKGSFIPGFVRGADGLPAATYPPPQVPANYQPVHKFEHPLQTGVLGCSPSCPSISLSILCRYKW